MRCLRHIPEITWQDNVKNNAVLRKAGISSLHTLLKQMRMRWLGHVTRMEDGRISKDLLYGELAKRKRPTGRPPTTLQGHMQARPQSTWHKHRVWKWLTQTEMPGDTQ